MAFSAATSPGFNKDGNRNRSLWEFQRSFLRPGFWIASRAGTERKRPWSRHELRTSGGLELEPLAT